ncbi:CHAD domain-containing protein [Agromyces lapidis]|uniref:CHAD domain-containing protein n=1 Tax=Agromyces lapidis TaxID=279574 RepID=A0ABV5SNU9_9MICO|nr:CHAD domain-containing protein [Agromyces lapidis]
MTAEPLLGDQVRDVISELIGAEPEVRRNTDDAVHRARTLTRRLRAFLPLVPGRDAEKAVRGLERYGDVLGAVRDLEVRQKLVKRLLGEFGDDGSDAEAQRLVKAVKRERRRAQRDVVDYLDGAKYRKLVDRLEAVRGVVDVLEVSEVRHEIRKHARALRYLAEALGDEQAAAAGTALQDAIGDQRDHLLLSRWLDAEAESDESIRGVRDAARRQAEEMSGVPAQRGGSAASDAGSAG